MPRKPTKSVPRRRAHPKSAPKTANNSALSIVILAAGQGKRMRSALPKVLQPLAGMPLLTHVLELARSLEPAAIHVVYGHGGEQVREHCGHQSLQWWPQAQQLGTGHALQQAMPGIPDAHQVLVLYGDVPLLRAQTLRALIEAAGTERLALLTAQLPEPRGYGRIVRNARGQLLRIVEEADASARERTLHEVNTGVLVAPASALRRWLTRLSPRNAQGEYYLTDVVRMAAHERQRLTSQSVTEACEVLGVNDKRQLAAAEAEYRRRRANELMDQGVTLIDPARIDIRGAVSVGRDVVLDVNVVLEGPLQLGDAVQVGAHCVLSQVSIGDRTVLHPHCVLQQAQVGKDCRIGPFARVRPAARLADGVHLGNFVEVKNSDIGAGSKINHLSYIGDSQLGGGVNIGAGTVTCNYDGVNKWRTQIGDGVFVGSGSMLVAPVKIGDGATIGAGSTITEDAPAGALTLARSRQLSIPHWQRPRKRTAGS